MAGTVNKVILIARLGADPEMRYSASGEAIANFNVATDEPVKKDDGTWDSRPEWHKISVFGKLAERCGEYLSKGKMAYIEGKLRTRSWEDKEGQKRYTTEIIARDVVFLGSRQDGKDSTEQSDHDKAKANGYQRDQPPQQHKPSSATTTGPGSQGGMPPAPSGDEDQDIPF